MDQVNDMKPIKWLNPLNWRWLIVSKAYALASGKMQRSTLFDSRLIYAVDSKPFGSARRNKFDHIAHPAPIRALASGVWIRGARADRLVRSQL